MKKKKILPLILSFTFLLSSCFSYSYEYNDEDITTLYERSTTYSNYYDFKGYSISYPVDVTASFSHLKDYIFPSYDGVNYSRLIYKTFSTYSEIYVLDDSLVATFLCESTNPNNPITFIENSPFAAIENGDSYYLYTTTGNYVASLDDLDDLYFFQSHYRIYVHIRNKEIPGLSDDLFLVTSSNISEFANYFDTYEETSSSSSSYYLIPYEIGDDYLYHRIGDTSKSSYVIVEGNTLISGIYDNYGEYDFDELFSSIFSSESELTSSINYLVAPTSSGVSIFATRLDTSSSAFPNRYQTEMVSINYKGKISLKKYIPFTFDSSSDTSYVYTASSNVSGILIGETNFTAYRLDESGEKTDEEVYINVKGKGKLSSSSSLSEEEEISIYDYDQVYKLPGSDDGYLLGVNSNTNEACYFYPNSYSTSPLTGNRDYELAAEKIDNFSRVVGMNSDKFVYQDTNGYYHLFNSSNTTNFISNSYLAITNFKHGTSSSRLYYYGATSTSLNSMKIDNLSSSQDDYSLSNYSFNANYAFAFAQSGLLLSGKTFYTIYSILSNSSNVNYSSYADITNVTFLIRLDVSAFYYRVDFNDGTSRYIGFN